MAQHQRKVADSFARQAPKFENPQLTLARRDYLDWMVGALDLHPKSMVLDVAAGTGHLSRAMAPFVSSVTAIDQTPEMLLEGRKQAEQEGLSNVSFEQGSAESLPYPSNIFDLVTSRFAVHHLEEPELALSEMARVCRSSGRVAVIDIVTPDDPSLALGVNELERLRDPSHTRALTHQELVSCIRDTGLGLVRTELRDIEVDFQRWADLTDTPREVREEIGQRMGKEDGIGMRPFVSEGRMKFIQRWAIVIGSLADTTAGGNL